MGLVVSKTKAGGGSSPGNPLFFDDFDYEIGRDDANKDDFLTVGGWTEYEEQATNPPAYGFLYTVAKDAIPGHESTPCPGSGGYVLCLESKPTTFGGQTDFSLQYGSTPGDTGTIPADCWFQFWWLTNRTGSQMSDFGSAGVFAGGGKFIYALHAGDEDEQYSLPAEHTAWMLLNRALHRNPSTGADIAQPEAGAMHFATLASYQDEARTETPRAFWPLFDGNGPERMTPTIVDPWVYPNQWYLLRFHFDISGAVGTYEGWMREYGTMSFTKFADFRPGVTPSGFTYDTAVRDRPGPYAFRLITTSSRTSGPPWDPDWWGYMADFALAAGENSGGNGADDLPTYESY